MAILKKQYRISELIRLWKSREKVEIPSDILDGISASSQYLEKHIAESKVPIYGITTGFGSLQNVTIPEDELHELQRNLLITHAAGTGAILDEEITRLMLLLKIINISKAHSAVRLEVLERLLWMYNEGYTPQVHSQGSLGASGDLAPLSEMVLPLIGLGDLRKSGIVKSTESVYAEQGLTPLVLNPKEALALINGTQFMLAHAIFAAAEVYRIQDVVHDIAALSADVFLCRKEPFFPQLHRVRPHQGQIQIAANMLERLEKSELGVLDRPAVQDPYSFRCIPQVHGASFDAIQFCLKTWEIELESVTDNPIVFPDDNLVLSGGNFHGQPLALTLDFAAIAIAELASISERRTYLLISGQRGLPPFLSANPGTDSGYMIAQYTAASLVSQNKQLCTPASVDSIVSSNGQEDHVSMGANAATKLLQVIENTKTVLAIEFLCGAQALHFRKGNTFPEAGKMALGIQLQKDAHSTVPMHKLLSMSREVLFSELQ